jgi:hypothetical protein
LSQSRAQSVGGNENRINIYFEAASGWEEATRSRVQERERESSLKVSEQSQMLGLGLGMRYMAEIALRAPLTLSRFTRQRRDETSGKFLARLESARRFQSSPKGRILAKRGGKEPKTFSSSKGRRDR